MHITEFFIRHVTYPYECRLFKFGSSKKLLSKQKLTYEGLNSSMFYHKDMINSSIPPAHSIHFFDRTKGVSSNKKILQIRSIYDNEEIMNEYLTTLHIKVLPACNCCKP